VDDALLVCVVQTVAHLDHQPELPLDGEVPALGDDPLELLALEELHDDEEPVLVLTEVVNRHHVWMIELGAGLRLAVEPGLQLLGRVDVAGDDLEGHQAVEDRIIRLEDGPHPPAPDAL
jgi:hypothetical protein